MIVINAENHVMGRLASGVAKLLLKSEDVVIVNAGKVVISGSYEHNCEIYKNRIAVRGDPVHGPFWPKKPQDALRRTIRGMLPYRTTRGAIAFKKLRVHNEVPEGLASKMTSLPCAENKLTCKFTKLEEILKGL